MNRNVTIGNPLTPFIAKMVFFNNEKTDRHYAKNPGMLQIMVDLGVCSSKGEARRMGAEDKVPMQYSDNRIGKRNWIFIYQNPHSLRDDILFLVVVFLEICYTRIFHAKRN